jgi:biotin carboxyl carrier protein
MATRHRFSVAGVPHTVSVDDAGDRLVLRIDDRGPIEVDATTEGVPGLFSIVRDGRPSRAYVAREGKALRVIVDGRTFVLAPANAGRERGAAGGLADPPGKITAPLAGVVVDVRVKPGDRVEPRQVVVVVEAMKMQNEVQAPHGGTVTSVRVQQGGRAEKGELLVEYTPDPEA